MQNAAGSLNRYKVLYAEAVYDEREISAVTKALENKFLAAGPETALFETELAVIFKKAGAVLVNSGSSANLLVLNALLSRGDKVITPACTFATTVAPLLQLGIEPHFVDCELASYVPSLEMVREAIAKFSDAKAILLPRLVGQSANLAAIHEIAADAGMVLIDDVCDTAASAKDSDIAITSFYGSHVITAMGMGGAVFSDDAEFLSWVRQLRDWGRAGNDSETSVKDIERKFEYAVPGYNMRMPDACAAFGRVQLTRLPEFSRIRFQAWNALYEGFQKWERFFILPHEFPSDSPPLAFALTVKPSAPFTRREFMEHMDREGIQTRVLFSGNILRHSMMHGHESTAELPNSDIVWKGGLLLGCHQGMTAEKVEYVLSAAAEFMEGQQ